LSIILGSTAIEAGGDVSCAPAEATSKNGRRTVAAEILRLVVFISAIASMVSQSSEAGVAARDPRDRRRSRKAARRTVKRSKKGCELREKLFTPCSIDRIVFLSNLLNKAERAFERRL
jgi:hypothetical protein